MSNALTNKLTDISLVIVIPVLIAFLYAAGRSFELGYLTEYGIQDSIGYTSFDEIMFTGFIAIFRGIEFIYLIIEFLMCILIATTISSLLINTTWFKKLSSSNFFKQEPITLNQLDRISNHTTNTALGLIFTIFLIVFFIAWLDVFHTKGQEHAAKEKVNFNKNYKHWIYDKKNNDPFFSRIYTSKNEFELGIIISANQAFISIYTNSGTKIFPANSVKIEQIVNK